MKQCKICDIQTADIFIKNNVCVDCRKSKRRKYQHRDILLNGEKRLEAVKHSKNRQWDNADVYFNHLTEQMK